MNDAGSGVLQAWVFERQGKHVDEVVFMMSGLGTLFYVAINGYKVVQFAGQWVTSPTMQALPLVGFSVPWELFLLLVNFYGNWNAKKLCTWLNGNSTAVISSLVPMLYRIMSGILRWDQRAPVRTSTNPAPNSAPARPAPRPPLTRRHSLIRAHPRYDTARYSTRRSSCRCTRGWVSPWCSAGRSAA